MTLDRARAKLFLRLSVIANLLGLFFLYRVSVTNATLSLLANNRAAANWTTSFNPFSRFSGDDDAQVAMGLWSGSGTGRGQLLPQCGMCEADPELCEKIGESNMLKSISYAGSNQRLRRVLAKMRNGEPFNVAVVGGSVSKGHGLNAPDNRYAHNNMHMVVFNHLNDLFPAVDGIIQGDSAKNRGKNGIINGAQGGVGTDYFSMCFGEHLPEDIDLVLLELAINDEVLMRNMDSYELLVRGLLDLPSKPAIINIHVFALMFASIANGGDLHTGLAQFYDLPILSLRNSHLQRVLDNATLISELFNPDNAVDENNKGGYDLRHIGPETHVLVGEMVNAYIDWQLCEMDRIEAREGTSDMDILWPEVEMPRMRLLQKYNAQTVTPKIEPNCFSTNAEKHVLVPVENEGWRNWNWNEKKYLIADEPGARISFSFTTSIGLVQLYYLRSAKFKLGSVDCWVDEDRNRRVRVDGYWPEIYNIGRSIDIRNDLAPGKHTLNCQVVPESADPDGGHEFRIISVMSI